MIEYILFDLDETLYPTTNGLMQAIGSRMREFIRKKYGLSEEEAGALQKRYWNEYGTTLRGLYLEAGMDPQEYLKYVHDVDLSRYLTADPRLRAVLLEIREPKVIVTNADAAHARRVLELLGVSDLFEAIFDIVFMQYECKPARGAYERVLNALGVKGEACILVEDAARNLPSARALGIHTILVGDVEPSPDAEIQIPDIYHVADAIRQLTHATAPGSANSS